MGDGYNPCPSALILFSGGKHDNQANQQHSPWLITPQSPTSRQLPMGLPAGLRRILFTHDRSAGTAPSSAPLLALYRLSPRLDGRGPACIPTTNRLIGATQAGRDSQWRLLRTYS